MEFGGWIALHRKFRQWDWYSDPVTKSVFIHLLITANWRNEIYMNHPVRRGQTVIGRKALAKELGISEQQVRTALQHLESTGEITRQTTNKFTIVTVVNFEEYQDDLSTNKTSKINQQINQVENAEKPCNTRGSRVEEQTINQQINQQNPENQPHLKNIEQLYIRENIYIAEIVNYLNSKSGKKYRQTESTKTVIQALLDAGYTVDDCKRVIDKKCSDWLGSKYETGLSPRSLFNVDKFDNYLNETVASKVDTLEGDKTELIALHIKGFESTLSATDKIRLLELEDRLKGVKVYSGKTVGELYFEIDLLTSRERTVCQKMQTQKGNKSLLQELSDIRMQRAMCVDTLNKYKKRIEDGK